MLMPSKLSLASSAPAQLGELVPQLSMRLGERLVLARELRARSGSAL